MTDDPGKTEPEWRQYERYVYKQLVEWGGKDSTVEFNKELTGRLSDTERQVDALVTGGYAGKIAKGVTAAVDCKFYSRNIDITAVEAFISFVDDLDVDLGLMITTKGYSKGAQRRRRGGIKLEVVKPILLAPPDDLPYVHSPAHDEPYYEGGYYDHSPYGDVGATVSFHTPDGESTDGEHPQDLDWNTDGLLSGTDDEVRWGDDQSRRHVAEVVLTHRLGNSPDKDTIEAFLDTIGADWEDGQPWVVYSGELQYHLGL